MAAGGGFVVQITRRLRSPFHSLGCAWSHLSPYLRCLRAIAMATSGDAYTRRIPQCCCWQGRKYIQAAVTRIMKKNTAVFISVYFIPRIISTTGTHDTDMRKKY